MKSILAIFRQFAGGVNHDAMGALARPHDPEDYVLPELDGTGTKAADIPLDGTRPDASYSVWPARTLAGCHEPLAPGVADLRGVWECYEGRMRGHVERVEQAGNRITITTGGLVHDMFADGTLENGVDDISGIGGRRIRVAATWEDGVHKLRPFNKKVVAVTRRIENGEMLWRYGLTTNKLRRLTEPPLDHPATRAAAEAASREDS